jgi:hypothetical protein
MKMNRRDLLAGIGSMGAGLVLSGCSDATRSTRTPRRDEETMGGEVTATEDLMREHGVLRRALFVYSEAVGRLRSNPSAVAPDALSSLR